MKWTRNESCCKGYSILLIGCHRICISHINNDTFFDFVYYKSSEKIFTGYVRAKGFDQAEQIVIQRIKEELSCRAAYANKLLSDFDKVVNANETLD